MMVTFPGVQSRTAADSAQLAHFIEAAEGRVDAYLSKRYSLPLADVPSLIETISNNIAVYEFLSKRVFTGNIAAESPWVNSFKESIRDLEKISNGTVQLVSNSGNLIESSNMLFWSSQSDYKQTHSEDDQVFQKIDRYKIDTIRTERSS